jgi:hypothetical protein
MDPRFSDPYQNLMDQQCKMENLYIFCIFIGSYSGTVTVVVIDYISTIEKLKSAIFLGLLLSDYVGT